MLSLLPISAFGRMARLAGIGVTALALLATGGPTVEAQFSDDLRFPHLERMMRQRQQARPPVERARPERRTSAPAAAASVEPAVLPKVDPNTFVFVLGDSIAELLGSGLEEAFGRDQHVLVTRRARADTGLVRIDYYDWSRSVADLLASGDRITHAVMLIGANDRQSIREGDVSHDPLSPRWREVYAGRVAAIARQFQERRIPLFWVGAPPMRNERLSADLIAINAILREEVTRAGGIFVDIWQAFVDGENRFAATGPDVNGNPVRIRTADGVHFTKAGARKLAFFVDQELRRLIDRGAGAIAALPTRPGEAPSRGLPANIEDRIIASLSPLPEPPGVPAVSVRREAGPTTPLTRAALAPGGRLVTHRQAQQPARSAMTPEQALVEQVYADGIVPDPVHGRADDFRWPRR